MIEFHPVHKYLGLLLLAATACDSDAISSSAGDADAATLTGDGGTTGPGDVDTSSETIGDTSSDDSVGLTVGHDSESTGTSGTGNEPSSSSTDYSDTVSATDGHSDTSGVGTGSVTSDTVSVSSAGSTSGTWPGSDTGPGTETGGPTTDTSVSDTSVSDTGVTVHTDVSTDATSEPGTTASSTDSASSTADTSTTTGDGGVSSSESSAVRTDTAPTSDTASSSETAPPDDTGVPGVMFEDNFDAEALDGSGYTFNYTTFDEWTVIGGTVDLISFPNQLLLSPGGYGDSQPADGVTVDLNGSNGHPGVMETQRSFTFHAGVTYQLSYALGAPFAETNGVRVQVMGGVFTKEESQAGIVPFAGYTATFTPDTTNTAKLRITSLGDNDNVGLFLDAVSLERLP